MWYGPDGEIFVAESEEKAYEKARQHYRRDDVKLTRDPDVLDTWFSSWLWPFATMGWPDITDDLKRYYPTDVLVTASEIIFFWVARMIMAGEHFCGEKPFHTVYIHGTVRDALGRKMSKSLGNGIDPLDVVAQYGRDALRFTIISQAAAGQDLFLEMKSFELGRNFANKLWNATRFLFLNIGEEKFTADEIRKPTPKSLPDRWILSRLADAVEKVNSAYDTFRLDEVVRTIHHFFWGEFCDWFLESAKLRIRDDRDEKVLALYVLESILRLMHPVLPYLTEELWHKLGEFVEGLIPADKPTIMLAPYPAPEEYSHWRDESAERDFERLTELVVAVRNIKGEVGIGTRKVGKVVVVPRGPGEGKLVSELAEYIKFLARVEKVQIASARPDEPCGVSAVSVGEVFLPLTGLVDIEKEIARLKKEIEKLERALEGVRKKLANEQFVSRAPKDVVEAERKKRDEFEKRLSTLKNQLDAMER